MVQKFCVIHMSSKIFVTFLFLELGLEFEDFIDGKCTLFLHFV